MKNIIKVAVLGGGGRTGKYVIDQLLNKGFGVKLLLRNPENLQNINPLVELIKGDAIDAQSIRLLLEGCQAVISTIGQRQGEPLVASEATINILNAMNEFGIQRYILLAGLNIDTPFDKKGEKTILGTEWMKTNFPVIQEDRQKTYNLLVESNVNWTLVRVPFIEFTDVSAEVAVSLEDCLGDKINATDVASFMVSQIFDDKFIKKSPFIANL
ncbi:NAD(P)-dependent oxidoreductase [Flavobacterium hydatis]|uniref:NADH-flavin reductase n=1 Tax=Flavobacterium hydatis TaxID=991 RepID=A0A086AF66_FLAHY|nr:NAD(P)H-binding protein [Flavobacterium hydatis]KFF15330.1 NADH-flavin reductase [Flavobacterium hydatis]OXA98266.1 NADH-flavin reductase [Flavobacterium hydatis]